MADERSPSSAHSGSPSSQQQQQQQRNGAGTPSHQQQQTPPPQSQQSQQSQQNQQGPAGHPSFRRQRASRACETCHARKVRCDAASLGVPCTNCVAFSIECKIPAPKRKKAATKRENDGSDRENIDSPTTTETSATFPSRPPVALAADNQVPLSPLKPQSPIQPEVDGANGQSARPKFARAPIKEAGRVAYLGESSSLSLLVHDKAGVSDVVHYPLPDSARGARARMTELDEVELQILHQRGAFLLPPRALCDELVEAYFTWVAPVVPCINRSRFMRRYRDSKNPPSLLLLQAVLLAGSRVCTNQQLMDANGSTTPAAMTFYKRAKALYDANYEDDRVTIVQALILMGWYWEGPEDVTKNVFYWSRVATVVAQGSGMHRSVEGSQLSRADKRIWKRIWWTLFTRDRSVATALGRPIHINVDDTDVEMITEEDFIEDEDDEPAEYPPDTRHVQFFLAYVRLCEIMGLVLSQQYSVATKASRQNAMNLTHSDMALADWLQHCPEDIKWESKKHNFWSALLHANYYTTLCLLHRAHMPPATTHNGFSVYPDDAAYPSRNIAFQAAGMITSIMEALQTNDELKYTPAFIVYSLFSALIMHVYQMRDSNQAVVAATQKRMSVCMDALSEVSKVWLVAKMVHTLFLSILGNKVLEERLQKAAGKRHKKIKLDHSSRDVAVDQRQAANANNNGNSNNNNNEEQQKGRFDEMNLDYPNGPPAPQVSFERSRPQTPAATPGREMGSGQMNGAQQSTVSPNVRHSDAFLPGIGTSRGNTRPPTPFNQPYSMPGTPPDIYLHTRGSPNLSQALWENFQPGQLFPESINQQMDQFGFGNSGSNMQQNLDPALQIPGMQQTPNMNGQMQNMDHRGSVGQGGLPPGMAPDGQWNSQQAQMSPDDTWSNSSRGGPAVPLSLNTEDWLQFFGVNHGDLSGATT